MGEVNWKSNTTKYFFRCETFWRPIERLGRIDYDPIGPPFTEEFPRCYFLGVYSNYWNMSNRRIEFAHYLGGGFSFPMGSEPGLEGEYIPIQTRKDAEELANSFDKKDLIWLFTSGIIPGDATDAERERLEKFRQDYQSERSKIAWSYEYAKVDNYIMQMWALAEKRKQRSDCFKMYYPYEPKVIPSKVPAGIPAPPPEPIPLNYLNFPTPTAASVGPSTPPQLTLQLTLKLGIKSWEDPYHLTLDTITQELL